MVYINPLMVYGYGV